MNWRGLSGILQQLKPAIAHTTHHVSIDELVDMYAPACKGLWLWSSHHRSFEICSSSSQYFLMLHAATTMYVHTDNLMTSLH